MKYAIKNYMKMIFNLELYPQTNSTIQQGKLNI